MARLNLLAAALALMGISAPVLADPIAIVVALAPIFGGTTAAFIATYGLTLLTVGYALISSNQAKRKQAAAAAAQRSQYNASLQDRNVTGLSAEASWQVVYGRPAPIGGSLAAIVSSGARDEFKHLVIVFAAHECESINEIYIDGEPVGALDANGDCTSGVFFEARNDETFTETLIFSTAGFAQATRPVFSGVIGTVTDGEGNVSNYKLTNSGNTLNVGTTFAVPTAIYCTYRIATGTSRVNIQKHTSLGGIDTVDAYLRSKAPAAWTVDDKFSGFTYAVVTLDQKLARFQGGPPNISARLFGKKVYDFRNGVTSYSANPALCLADFLMSEPGYGVTLSQFDVSSVIAAANACAAQGFSCDGAFKTEQDRETTKQQIEDSFGGTCHMSGGVWRITPGAWTAPIMALTDADCAAPIQITQASYTSKERFNTVRGKYIDDEGLGVSTDFKPWQNPAHVVTDGFVKVKDIALPFTRFHQSAQDLARMLVERSRGGLTITYPGQMRLWPLQPGDRVSVTNAEFGWAAKTFRVTDWAFHPKSPVALTLVEDVAVYYDAAAVVTVDAAPNTNLRDPFVTQDLLGLSAASGTAQLLMQADGTVVTRILWAWTASTDNYVTTNGAVQRQWRLASAVDNNWNSLPDEQGDETNAYQMDAPDGALVLLRARFVNQLGILGAWATITHTVVGKTAPPSNVGLPSYVLEGFGIRIRWPSITDADLNVYEIRVDGSSWETATFLTTTKSTNFLWATQKAGTRKVWIKAIDLSRNYSLNAALLNLVIAAPDASNLTATFAGPNIVLAWLASAASFAIDRYVVRWGATWAAGIQIASPYATNFSEKVTFSGARKFWVAVVDVAGNYSAAVSVDVSVNNPDQVAIQSEVIDNNVLLRWTESTTTLPVDRYEIRKGASYALGQQVGDNGNGRFAAFFEQASGTYTYWITAYDTAGNASAPASVSVLVNQPPDYVLRDNYFSTFTGTRSGVWLDTGKLYAPLFDETWQQHFASRGWAGPQAQINAGFPRYFQPSNTAAFYEEVVDYGAVLPSIAISATVTSNVLFGAVTITPTISVKTAAGDAWTNYPGQSQIVATGFRYVKVRYNFVASGGDDLMEVIAINIKLASKLKSDAGDGLANALDVGGTTVTFAVPFIDVSSITVTPKGTTARIGIYDFTDTPYPTNFKVLLYDTNGNRVSGPFSWAARGN